MFFCANVAHLWKFYVKTCEICAKRAKLQLTRSRTKAFGFDRSPNDRCLPRREAPGWQRQPAERACASRAQRGAVWKSVRLRICAEIRRKSPPKTVIFAHFRAFSRICASFARLCASFACFCASFARFCVSFARFVYVGFRRRTNFHTAHLRAPLGKRARTRTGMRAQARQGPRSSLGWAGALIFAYRIYTWFVKPNIVPVSPLMRPVSPLISPMWPGRSGRTYKWTCGPRKQTYGTCI